MKIWRSFGSEHSYNIVLIGHFQTIDDANETRIFIDLISRELEGKIDLRNTNSRFDDEIFSVLQRLNCYFLGPSELEQLFYDYKIKVKDKEIIITTDEFEISTFFKIMINKGAKIEIYSAHDYLDSEYARNKGMD